MGKRRTFTAEFKTEVVLAVLRGTHSVSELCRTHQLKPQVITNWKRTFLESANQVFAGDPERQALQERIAELERLVGRQALELEVLKKPVPTWA